MTDRVRVAPEIETCEDCGQEIPGTTYDVTCSLEPDRVFRLCPRCSGTRMARCSGVHVNRGRPPGVLRCDVCNVRTAGTQTWTVDLGAVPLEWMAVGSKELVQNLGQYWGLCDDCEAVRLTGSLGDLLERAWSGAQGHMDRRTFDQVAGMLYGPVYTMLLAGTSRPAEIDG